jgi:hypothetical protein
MDRRIVGLFFRENDALDGILPLLFRGFTPEITNKEAFRESKYSTGQSPATFRHCKINWEMQSASLQSSAKKFKSPRRSLESKRLMKEVSTLKYSWATKYVMFNRFTKEEGIFQHLTSGFLKNMSSTY